MAKPRRVEVRWEDAAGARYKRDARTIERNTIGWMTKKDKRIVQVAQTRDRWRYEDFVAIPRANVRRIRRLK